MLRPMKTAFFALLSLSAIGCASTTPAAPTYLLRVEQQWSRASMPERPNDDLPDAEYQPAQSAADRWRVSFRAAGTTVADPLHGEDVVLEPVAGGSSVKGTADTKTSSASERRYVLEQGTVAGGSLRTDGKRATVTLYGSGVPVAASERGSLRPAP